MRVGQGYITSGNKIVQISDNTSPLQEISFLSLLNKTDYTCRVIIRLSTTDTSTFPDGYKHLYEFKLAPAETRNFGLEDFPSGATGATHFGGSATTNKLEVYSEDEFPHLFVFYSVHDMSNPRSLTGVQTNFVGDSGSGGAQGLVPPPSAGDAAAGKYLDSDGTWSTPPDVNTQLPLIDSDTMVGASATNVASAESVKAYVDAEVAAVVDTAPATLNTLNELAAALNDDANFSTTVTTNLGLKAPIASPTFTGTIAIPNIANIETAIAANTLKTSFPGFGTSGSTALVGNTALLQLGTSSTTALAGDTALLQLGTSGTTALAGNTTTISGGQASAITANTAKTGITTSQANAITANTAKPDLTVDGAGTVHANNYTDTQYSVMGSGNGYAAGLVKAGGVLHNSAFLRKDGSWAIPPDTTYSEATSSAEGLMSTAHHDKLDGIAAGAEVNVQSDWNSSSGDNQILNKPTIPAAYVDADAVSAVQTADDYLKNDASDTMAGALTLESSLFLQDDTGSTTTKSKIQNNVTTVNRTITVPDASGVIALTSDLPPAAVSTGVIKWLQAKVVLSEAQLNSMHSTPIQLVAHAGTDTIIMVGDALALVDRDGSTAQSAAVDLCIGYDGTTVYNESILYERRFMYNESGDRTWSLKADYSGEVGASLTAAVDKDVTAAFTGAITSGSLDSVTLYLQYYIIDNS